MVVLENKMEITYDFLKENNLILFEVITGSQAYGTNIETSDVDKKFIYILPEDFILGTKYIDQLTVNKDFVGFEIKRFLELVKLNNPLTMELLFTPDDCIIYKHPVFDEILKHKNEFITKLCKDTFGGYAKQQIKKANGLDKKQNWEKEKIRKKDVLDFVYVIDGYKSVPWKKWNENNTYDEKFCGIVKLPNSMDVYSLFYDKFAELLFSSKYDEKTRETNLELAKKKNLPLGNGYKGLVKIGNENGVKNYGVSNQLRLSSIPKGEKCVCNIIYNKDAYTKHCKDYKEYQQWLLNRNETRYVETKTHGQKIDSKNMMHCIRLISMCKEIGERKGIKVRRDDREYLLSIRRGELNLETLILEAEKIIENINIIFEKSELPDIVDDKLIENLLIGIRKTIYKTDYFS